MKILCIDLNIIMAPCIRLYMDRVHEAENSEVVWRMLEQKTGIGAHLMYDAGVLLALARLIKNNTTAKFFTTENQQQNVALIEDLLENGDYGCRSGEKGEMLHITNIDFFSDVGLRDDKGRFDFGVYGDDSWYGFLVRQYDDAEFLWVKAPESEVPREILQDSRIGVMSVTETDSLSEDHDVIILSYSGQYVPYCYRHLGNLLEVVSA